MQPLPQAKAPVAENAPTPVTPNVAPVARPISPKAMPSGRSVPVQGRGPQWKLIAIGSGGLLALILLSYLLVNALTGPSKSKTTEPDKDVAVNPPPGGEHRTKKNPKKENKPSVKKTEPEVKEPPKKTEPEVKEPAKKTEPEPKDPPKKTEPEPKDPPKKTEPEPKDPPKKEEMKKDPPDERIPVPTAEEIAKADALVRDLLKADYAKTKPADRVAFAARLLDEAAGTKDEAARYVMIRDARNFAAAAGNATLAMTAAGEISTEFQVSAAKASATAAELIAAANLTPTTASECADVIFAALDTARGADDWSTAISLARSAEMVARKSQSAILTAMAQTKLREAETMRVEAEKVKDHIATLKTNPDDPDANLAVGRFYCLIKQDWEAGIEYLAKGSNEQLKLAAKNDQAAGGGSEDDRAKAGDSWYELSRTADPSGKFAMQLRAHFWYTGAAAGLTGLEKVKLEKRLAELQATLDARAVE